MGSIVPSGSARIAGSLVAVQRVARTLPSGPRMRRLEATLSTRASPRPRCVTGCARGRDSRTARSRSAITWRWKRALVLARIEARFLQDAFRREVAVRRIVLMERMHGHPAEATWRRRGPGQRERHRGLRWRCRSSPRHRGRSAPPRPTGRCLAPAAQAPSGWSPDHRPSSSQREGWHPRRRWPRAGPPRVKPVGRRIRQRRGQRRLRTGGQRQEQAGQACWEFSSGDNRSQARRKRAMRSSGKTVAR